MEGMERNQRACIIEVKNVPPRPSENPEMLCTIGIDRVLETW